MHSLRLIYSSALLLCLSGNAFAHDQSATTTHSTDSKIAMQTSTLTDTSTTTNTSTTEQAEQDYSASADLFKTSCRNCHGPTGKGLASFPKVAGYDKAYLQMRLMQYKNGEQVGPNTALMRPNVVNLSDEEIENLAGYIAATFQ